MLAFSDAVIAGLAGDGGLYVPATVPDVRAKLAEWRSLPYNDLCRAIFQCYCDGNLGAKALGGMIEESYAAFPHADVTPLVRVGEAFVLELFHGPTLAFKDLALQFLGILFEHLLRHRGTRMTVLGATSGDTGSAAIHALRGKRGIEVFMLHPHGRVSPMQRRQMTTVPDANIHCVAVEGSFDDAQAVVKDLFNDHSFNDEVNLGAVNSINWARIMAQIVYYFYAYFRLLEWPSAELPARRAMALGAPVRFAVPTGNFGHIYAGYLAKRMGLPIERLILATNANEILHRFVQTGVYRVGQVMPTVSPSMDIQVASNFERYLFELAGRDASQLRSWMSNFSVNGELKLDTSVFTRVADDFVSAAVDEAETLATMREVWERHGYLFDPHTAVGVQAARIYAASNDAVPTICMATAHPAKFAEAVHRAIGEEPPLPPSLAGLGDLPERLTVLPAESGAVRTFIRETLTRNAAGASVGNK